VSIPAPEVKLTRVSRLHSLRTASASLEHHMRSLPRLAEALGGAGARARGALAAAASALPAAAAAADHPKLGALRAVLATMDALDAGSKAAVAADPHAFTALHAAAAAARLPVFQLRRGGADCDAESGGITPPDELLHAAAAAGARVLLLTPDELAACAGGLAATGVRTLVVFTAGAAYANEPPFRGQLHTFDMEQPEAAAEAAEAVAAAPWAPSPPTPTAEAAAMVDAEAEEADGEELVTLLVAMDRCSSEALRALPALRDGLLRLEGPLCGACVAERRLGPSAPGSPAFLAAPDAAALGRGGAVAALRLLRGAAELDGFAAALSGPGSPSLAGHLRAFAARYPGGLILVLSLPDAAAGARLAPALARLAGAAAAAGLRLAAAAAIGEADAAEVAVRAVARLALPARALRPMADSASPAEEVLCCVPHIGPLHSHALLSGGASLSALLRADVIPDAAALCAVAARGGLALGSAAAEALAAFRLVGANGEPRGEWRPPAAAAEEEEEGLAFDEEVEALIRSSGPSPPPHEWRPAQAAMPPARPAYSRPPPIRPPPSRPPPPPPAAEMEAEAEVELEPWMTRPSAIPGFGGFGQPLRGKPPRAPPPRPGPPALSSGSSGPSPADGVPGWGRPAPWPPQPRSAASYRSDTPPPPPRAAAAAPFRFGAALQPPPPPARPARPPPVAEVPSGGGGGCGPTNELDAFRYEAQGKRLRQGADVFGGSASAAAFAPGRGGAVDRQRLTGLFQGAAKGRAGGRGGRSGRSGRK